MPSITLYNSVNSGHCHRVRLLLNMLELPYATVDATIQVRRGEKFLALNPFGQVPVIIDGDIIIADSNAILIYLVKQYAPGSHWLPEDAVTAARIQQWLGKAAGEIRYGLASARLIRQFAAREDYPAACAVAGRFLPQLEACLKERRWLAAYQATIADLACYGYIASAPEGGISLAPYPAIQYWLARVEALPGFEALPPLPLPDEANG